MYTEWNRCALTNTKWMMGDKTCHFSFLQPLIFYLFLKYVAESEEKICSQNKIATQTRLKSAHVHISICYMTSFEFLNLQYFFFQRKLITPLESICSHKKKWKQKMASKTRFNSTHQSLLTTWHVWIFFKIFNIFSFKEN